MQPVRALGQQIYVVIHGETEAHVQKKICGGGWDLPLNDEGLRQARMLAKQLAGQSHGIRVIFSSPLLRCVQTTDVLHDVLKVKVRVISGLAERGLGQWERAEIASLPGFSALAEQVPGGENLNRFRARIREAADYVLDNSDGAAMIVSHGIFGEVFLDLFGIRGAKLERCVLYRVFREGPTIPWRFEAVSAGG